jgi:hypothetical protein
MLDRPLEQRAQPLGDLLGRHAVRQPLGWNLEALAEVVERVAGDDRTAALDPQNDVVRLLSQERLDSDGQPIARREQMPLDRVPS